MIYFILYFALLSAVHLYTCYFHLDKLRMATKPLLLLSLALFYAFAAENFNWMILLALVCGMVGDIFLLWPDNYPSFVAGASTFSLGHVFYSIVLSARLIGTGASFSPWVILFVALPYITAVAVSSVYIMSHINKAFLKMTIPLYFGLVGLVNVSAWLALVNAAQTGAWDVLRTSLLVTGGILFFISDTILVQSKFINDKKHSNFYVMLTYTAAQFCLCLGFIRFL